MTIRLSILSTLMLAAAAAAACDVKVTDQGVSLDINEGGRAEDEWTRSYTLPKGGHFDIEASNGNVEVVAATGNAVEVRATREARAKNDEAARDLLKQHQITEEVAPDRVRVRAAAGERAGGFRQRVRIDYHVSVPPGLMVSVKNENGGVTLTKVQGRFTVGSTNGRIEGHGVSGGLDFETVNGGVVMEMAAVTDDVRIRTVNGGVMLGLPDKLNATVDATTINGGVLVNDTLPLVTTTKERQRLSGRLGTGSGPRIDLQTTNGGVRLGGGEPPR